MKATYSFLVLILLGVCLGATPAETQSYEGPTLESTKLETVYSEEGLIKWRMCADTMLQYENKDRSFPEGIYIEFFEADQQIIGTGRANSVYFSAERNVYELRGDVELKSLREKRQLNTEELYWNAETEKVYTDKFLRIESENAILTGQGLTANQDLSQYHISKPQGLLNVQSTK